MANCIFVNALYEWNATMTNSSAHLNVIGNYISLVPCIISDRYSRETIYLDSACRKYIHYECYLCNSKYMCKVLDFFPSFLSIHFYYSKQKKKQTIFNVFNFFKAKKSLYPTLCLLQIFKIYVCELYFYMYTFWSMRFFVCL